jgi:nitrate reductase NapAB chaperone NapD
MSGVRGILAAVVAITLLASAALAGVAAGQNQVTLTVTVVDGDGDSVADADLTAEWNGGDATETTRSNGQALIDVPEGADVTITVDHPQYVRNQPYEVEDASGEEVEVGVVRSGTATIEVVDDDGPLADAIVRLRQDGNIVVNSRTGSDGTLRTDAIERDTYRLTTFKEGYERNRTDLVVDGSVEQTMHVSEGSVALTVTAMDDHYDPARAVRNATVSVADIGSVRTLSGGEATISVPVNDEYEVTVDKDGYDASTTSVDVSEDPAAQNVTINRSPLVNVTAANDRVVVGESVRVTVVDEYGEAVEGATVSLDGAEVGSTDADGELDVTVESEGEHTIHAASGDASLTDTTTVEGVEPGAEETVVTTAPPTNTTSEGGPGFTPTTALLAIVALIAIALLVRN